ncbi:MULTISPECIES: hypothetical protein [Paenibacillus]|jgi:hypothetical protein|uniref:Uncharacterized protein n=2 Tax=Paenibacillus TaxID=44249 RepID=A0ABT8J5J3_9BACL|nr:MULTISPECIES: hypothetical protein [Paenibacillus]MDN4600357.1 hypothetical protein [Paenibacillus vandeheii]
MYTTEQAATTKTIMITVNGEPIGRELIIDSITYAPITEPESVQKLHKMGMNPSAI